MKHILLGIVFLGASWAQVAQEANQGYKTPEGRAGLAKRLGGAARDAQQKPQELVDALGLQPGTTVADIGTGVGYMLRYLSRAVGPQGRVLAEDIFDDFLKAARERAQKENLANVTFIRGTESDPKLPPERVDVILALDSYHHYDFPARMLAAFHGALRPGGRLVIVEFYKRPGAMDGGNAMQHIRLDQADLIQEVESNRFRLVAKHDHIPDKQYMAVFEATK